MSDHELRDNEVTRDEQTRLALIEERHKDLHRYLMGNGKPGKIADMDAKLDSLKTDMNNLSTKVTDDFNKLRTTVLLLVSSGGAGIGAIVTTLLGG